MPIEFHARRFVPTQFASQSFSSSQELVADLLKTLTKRSDATATIELFRRIRPTAASAIPRAEPAAKNPVPQSDVQDPKGVLTSGFVHPGLALKIQILLRSCQKRGLSVMVFEGYRHPKRQDELFAKGGVTRARGGRSWHNYGLAVDVVFKDASGNPSWNARHDWKALGRLGKSLGLTWGGDFTSIKDLAHFEWHPGLNLNRAQKIAERGTWKDVWGSVGKI